jgi:response regulator RpfG family c-di-GMP phosphodiesterase
MLHLIDGGSSHAARVLVVYEDTLLVSVLRQQLSPEGFEVTVASKPEQAMELLHEHGFSIILAEQEMKAQPGLEFLKRVKAKFPWIARILVTRHSDSNNLLNAVNDETIFRFILKPWSRGELIATMRHAAAHHWLFADKFPFAAAPSPELVGASSCSSPSAYASQPQTARSGSVEINEPDRPVMDALCGLARPADPLRLCTQMLHAFHPNLGNTAARAVEVCRTLGEMLYLPPQELKSLIWAAAFHDVSLVGIDRLLVRRWLRSPEKCTKQDWEMIKTHPAQSEQMVAFIPELKRAGEIIRSHHENWDGTGYPDKLCEEAIPWPSRLLAVVITYCSKYSTGPTAFFDLQAKAGRMFDPQAVTAVCKAIPFSKMPPGEREVLLTELKAGMVLARDVVNRDGFLILPKGQQLKESTINKLMQIHRVAPINPSVLVNC